MVVTENRKYYITRNLIRHGDELGGLSSIIMIMLIFNLITQ